MGTRLASPATWPATGADGSQCGPSSAYRALHNFSPHIFPIKRHLDTNRGLTAGLSGSTGCFPCQQPSPRAGLGGEEWGRPWPGSGPLGGQGGHSQGKQFSCLSVCLSARQSPQLQLAGEGPRQLPSVCLRDGMSPVCLHPEPEAEPKDSGLAGAQGSRGRGLAAH